MMARSGGWARTDGFASIEAYEVIGDGVTDHCSHLAAVTQMGAPGLDAGASAR